MLVQPNLWFFIMKKGEIFIRNVTIMLTVLAGLFSIGLWISLNFFNPYTNVVESEIVIRTLFLMVIPACLGVAAAITNRVGFMFVIFLWSLPMSFYLFFTPGIFAWYGIVAIAYLVSFLLMRKGKKDGTL